MALTGENFLYLGGPDWAKKPRAHWYLSWLEQTRALLTGWNKKNLIMAGRLTLIKSVLASRPAFLFRTVPVPKNFINTIEKHETIPLGRGQCHAFGRMGRVCTPFQLGRLNIRSCVDFQSTLLCKHISKLFANYTNLWVIGIGYKYGKTFSKPK